MNTPDLIPGAMLAAQTPQEWAVGWLTLALINAGLAQSKHRSGLNWWLISLLLGPFATLLLVAVFDSRPPATR
jgi:hypothetical protein